MPAQAVGQDRTDYGTLARSWYVNRCPFVTRFWAPGRVGSKPGRGLRFPVQKDPEYRSTPRAILPGFVPSPFAFQKTMQFQNLIDDMELFAFYGECWNPRTPPDSARSGLATILTTNRSARRKDACSYHPSEFAAETVGRCRAGGGDPDILFLSTDWFHEFGTWGQEVRRIPDGETEFGEPIETFGIPALGGVKVIEAPLLRRGVGFCLTSSEVRVRMVHDVSWNTNVPPIRNSTVEWDGEWVAEFAVEVENEAHHSCIGLEG